ncbi:putative Hpt domain protein [uncultured Desulfobacterium sp.]|uniref:Putative Hpt domain protein n=1 Tax=uncultured Desulfobacterium sp. TaxID=201089 RepID=A0A445N3A9_9BACT|nr:putative Hpt domain protein [uncultured Desulfobacterium sp.]
MNLNELAERLELEPDEYLDLLNIFIEKSQSEIEEMMSALEEDNMERLAKLAHSVKGAAINLGLNDLYEASRYIENMTSNLSLEGVPESIQALIRGMHKVMDLAEK